MIDQVILTLFVGGIFLTLGDLTAKKWIESSGGSFLVATPYYLLSLVFYCIGVTLFAFSLRYKNLAAATILLIFFNVLTVALAGYFFYNEKFSLLQIFGICVGILSVVILELAE